MDYRIRNILDQLSTLEDEELQLREWSNEPCDLAAPDELLEVLLGDMQLRQTLLDVFGPRAAELDDLIEGMSRIAKEISPSNLPSDSFSSYVERARMTVEDGRWRKVRFLSKHLRLELEKLLDS